MLVVKPEEAKMRGRWVGLLVAVGLVACLCVAGCGGGGSSVKLLVITTTALPKATVGAPYTPQLLATGGTPAYTWSQTSGGAMPDGVTMSSSGQFSGIPTVPGTFGPYVFKVTDSASTPLTATTASLSIEIDAATLSVTTSSLPNGTTGAAYSTSLAATGGAATYTWAETSGGAMPPGIADITSAGVISGTPTAPGTYGPYVFTVTDSNGGTAASASLTITVTGTAATQCTPQGNEGALTASTPYAFLLQGTDGSGKPVAFAGSFTPNGSGGITSALLDYNGFSSGPQHIQVDLTGSSYSFGTSTLGCLSLPFQSTSATAIVGVTGVNFSFSLTALDGSAVYQEGRIIESDNASGSGTRATGSIHVQTATDFAVSALQPRYAFGVDGWKVAPANSRLYRTTFAGSFGNASGTLSAGYADLNEGGTPSGELTGGSGQLGAIDATTGRGTGTFAVPVGLGNAYTLDFTFYVINGSALYLLSSDSPVGVGSPALLSGRALVSSTSFSTGALDGYYAAATEGLDTAAGSGRGKNAAQIATINATSAGAIPTAKFYTNDAGQYTTLTYTNATYTVDAAAGRASLTSANNKALPIVYLTASSFVDDSVVGFVVGNDATAQSGILVNQSTSAPNYSLASVTGNYASSTAEDVDGVNGAFLGAFNFNGTGGYTVESKITGSLTNAPSAGTITINPDGSGSLDAGNFPLVTNGSVVFAIPNTGDPLLYVITSGTN
jgi:hypothetical protein